MSRSYKKNPFGKGCVNYNSNWSEKQEKQLNNRNTRRVNKQHMRELNVDELNVDELEFEQGNYWFGWDPWDNLGVKSYFGDLNSCRQALQLRYRSVDRSTYHIETEEHIEIAKEQFNLTEGELQDMIKCVSRGWTSYLTRNEKYELEKSFSELLSDNQEEYKRCMRK